MDNDRKTMPDNGTEGGEIEELHSCRICGSENQRVYFIFAKNPYGQNLADKLNELFSRPVSPEDQFSNYLCISCADGVNIGSKPIMNMKQKYDLHIQRQVIPLKTLFTQVPPNDDGNNTSTSSSCSCSSSSSSSSGEEGEKGEDC